MHVPRFHEQVRSAEIRRYTFLSVCSRIVHPEAASTEVFTSRIRSSTRSRGTGKRNSRVGTIPTFNRQSKIPCMEHGSFGEMSKVAREFLTFAQKLLFLLPRFDVE